jgi:hypothetical protein
MIAVLGGLADVERDLICTRTAKGRSRAQKRGQRMGRKPKLTEAQQDEARRRRAACHACRTRAQLPRGQEHDFEAGRIKAGAVPALMVAGMPQYSVDVLDHLTAPKLTSLTACGAVEVPALPDYDGILSLNQVLGSVKYKNYTAVV